MNNERTIFSKGKATYECEICAEMTEQEYENSLPVIVPCKYCGHAAFLDHATNIIRGV
jgi:ribosomal protein S27E